MKQRPGLRIEDAIMMNELCEVARETFGRNVIQFGETEPPPTSDIAWISNFTCASDDLIVTSEFHVGSVVLVGIAVKYADHWDLFIKTLHHGYQLTPNNPADAYVVPLNDDLKDAAREVLMEVLMRTPSVEYVEKWYRNCCEMNGVTP